MKTSNPLSCRIMYEDRVPKILCCSPATGGELRGFKSFVMFIIVEAVFFAQNLVSIVESPRVWVANKDPMEVDGWAG